MEDVREAPVPMWFWVVAVVALLWEAMGCYAYLTQVRASDDVMPVWATAAFAVAVWVGLLGAVLLLTRRRWARTALIVSLIAVIVQVCGLYLASPGGGTSGTSQAAFPAFVALVGAV
ncbi:MAG: hypothetical protein QOJ27_601, partial [Sphingomonadales bacterium]|nr:hypothetical protein [Sphingomonadales bacterium]